MDNFFFVALGALVLVTMLVMPWVAFIRVKHLEADVEELRRRLENKLSAAAPVQAPIQPPIAEPIRTIIPTVIEQPEPEAIAPIIAPPIEEAPVTPAIAQSVKDKNFEMNFGAKLPVWIGGIALALSGYYLVRYSIEAGLLGPAMRTFLALIFGGGLVIAARKVGPSNARVGQALAGAGIAVLYFALFAATTLHDLIPRYLGFLGMSGVTALAMVMALRHGAPIAILGMVGGFLTPLLIGSQEPNTPMLLSYLYVLFSGLFFVIRRNGWWGLLLLLAPFALIWAAIVLITAPPEEAIFVGLFMLAIGFTVVTGTRGLAAELGEQVTGLTAQKVSTILNAAVISIGAMMIGVATAKAGFGLMDRALLFTLAAASLGLAWFDHQRYRYAPVLTLIVSLATLAAWTTADAWSSRYTLLAFALLHTALPLWLVAKKREPLFWALVASVSAALFYLFAYARMGAEIERITLWPLITPLFWGGLALGIAAIAVEATRRAYQTVWTSEELRQKLLAVFAATATGFIAIGLSVELQREFLSVAIAAEMLALTWLNAKLEVSALRKLAGITALVFAGLLVPQIVLLVQLSAYSLFEAKLYWQESLPLVNWPVFQLGLPAVCFALGSLLLRQHREGRLVDTFETAAIALIGVMGYYLMRHAFHPDENVLFSAPASFIERGAFTNVLMVFGLACTYIATRFDRRAIARAGLVVMGVGVFRLFWFDLFLHNPLFNSAQSVGRLMLINGLTLTFALPLLWLHSVSKLLPQLKAERLSVWVARIAAVLIFAYANFTLRHLFHGDDLSSHFTSNGEMYSYSALWLVLAITLLVEGTRRRIKGWRMAAIGLMFVTVGKVFMLDADALEGLWRVFSFLGLGLSLIGLSWFTTRFVLKED